MRQENDIHIELDTCVSAIFPATTLWQDKKEAIVWWPGNNNASTAGLICRGKTSSKKSVLSPFKTIKPEIMASFEVANSMVAPLFDNPQQKKECLKAVRVLAAEHLVNSEDV